MKKQIIKILFLCAFIILILGAISVSAETYNGFHYKVDVNNEVIITGLQPNFFGHFSGVGLPEGSEDYDDYIYDYDEEYYSSLDIIIPSEINGLPVTKIGDGAFYKEYILATVEFPESITHIGNGAFYDCLGLIQLNIPKNVEHIGQEAFSYCANLMKITVHKDNPNYSSYEGNLYNKNMTELITYASGKAEKEFTIPDGIITIAYGAFCHGDRNRLKKLTIPDSVISIPDSCFAGAWNLETVIIGNGVEIIPESAFHDCGNLKNVQLGDNIITIGEYAFSDCVNLGNITLPNKVSHIGEHAFSDCVNLRNITLSNKVSYIGEYAFSDCENLRNIIMPKSVTKIGRFAFDKCVALETINYGGNKDEWLDIYISYGNDCFKDADVNFESPFAKDSNRIDVTKTEHLAAWVFDVDFEETYENSYVYAAIYDEDDTLVSVEKATLDEKSTFLVRKTDDDCYAKLFFWKDGMTPIFDSENMEL